MRELDTYLKYGINIEFAGKLIRQGLSISKIKKLPSADLISIYGLDSSEVQYLKKLFIRQPIPDDVLNELLENNNYVCCVCKGVKSDSYVIHHITPYSMTRDNSYSNLAVLCPADHDLAHREGIGLTSKLTPKQIINAKTKWEKDVKKYNSIKACISGTYSHVEYCNIERIIDLCIQTHGCIPKVELTDYLIENEILLPSGLINDTKLSKDYPNRVISPLNFFAGGGAAFLREYCFQLFQSVLNNKEIFDLDILLNKTALTKNNLIGTMCIYIGGIYGTTPKIPVTIDSSPVKMYIRRKPFYVTWIIDPRLMTSNTATIRIGGHNIHFICGTIRSIDTIIIKGEKFIHYDIRPYVMGAPSIHFNRRPNISYRNDNDMVDLLSFFDDEEL